MNVVTESDILNPPTVPCIDPNGALWRLLKLQQHFDLLAAQAGEHEIPEFDFLRKAVRSKVPLLSVLMSLGLGVASPAALVKLWDERYSKAPNPAEFLLIAKQAIALVNNQLEQKAALN